MTQISSLSTEEFAETEKFAEKFRVKGNSVRRAFCVNGNYMGIKPIKLPNGRLLWSIAEAEQILASLKPSKSN